MKYSYRGYETDPENGIVYGKRGNPIRRICNGYKVVFPKVGSKRLFFCHRAIWISVNGEIPLGMQINHINGAKADNRLCNLELVTPRENALHAYKLGLSSAKGEKNGRCILSQVKVLEILSLRGQFKLIEIAKQFGVSKTTISNIFTGKTWGVDAGQGLVQS